MIELHNTIAFTSDNAFVIDNLGRIWWWPVGFCGEPKLIKGECLPKFVSLSANRSLLVAIDEYGSLWKATLNPFINVTLVKQHFKRAVVYVHVYFEGSMFFMLTKDGELWKDLGGHRKRISNVPPFVKISINKLSGAIDTQGKIWVWKKGTRPHRIELPFKEQAISVISEGCILKILSKDGRIWKYSSNVCKELFDNAILPKFVSLSASGKHSIGIDEHGNAWSWGNNSNQELGIYGIPVVPIPRKVNHSSPLHSVVCGPNASLIITKEGDLCLWKDGRKTFPEIPQAMTHLYKAKSARK